ncbi:Anti-sigma-K factor RskA [Arthrobacter saudimassiliensis]|uniref:Regulator of SigK n=1 Tax=Arthrobacter saudimassiliensis TaxID=1461584 RepID=A0A078MWD8_9MICC|nr:Anti-sigma-K factor RskA [Arthrobacter saudimassiliensis]
MIQPDSSGVNFGNLHDLAALYAVDALSPEERTAFEQHLAGCRTCRDEVAGFSEAAAGLAAGTALAPPPELRDSVLAAVRNTQPQPGQQAPRGLSPLPSTPVPGGPAERRHRRSRRLLAAAGAVVLVPGIALAGWALGVRTAEHEQEQLAAAEQERLSALLAAPDIAARSVDVEGAAATLLFSERLDEGLFVGPDLPAPEPGSEYQLWLVEGGTPVPDARFKDGGERGVWLRGNVSAADAVALTLEPEGGSVTPTDPLLAVAPIDG